MAVTLVRSSGGGLTTPSLSPAWKRVEEHYGAAWRFGRQAIEEAWRCGDALIAAKAETKHGEWLPALKAVGISHDAAKRLMLLRQKYSEIVQIALFDSVSDALKPQGRQVHNTGEFEWYTPGAIIEAARACMGGIDLDPASCVVAQQTVRATTFYDMQADGLTKPWSGRVWLNPPFATPLIGPFIDKVTTEPLEQACVLVNNCTETKWAQVLVRRAASLCLFAGRVRFLDRTGADPGTPLQGQMLAGIGVNVQRFNEAFGDMGTCLSSTSTDRA